MSLLTQIFGSRNQRLLKQYQKTVREINALEPAIEKLSDAELQAKTPAFKERIAAGESLDALLPEAFAVCREASKRVLGKIDWNAVQAARWTQCKEGKQAEFLLEQRFPWHLVERIGVQSANVYRQVVNALPAQGHRPTVEVLPNWYY